MIQQQEDSQKLPTWLQIIRLLRWDKPVGRLILIVPALWAVFLAARGTPPAPLVSLIVFVSVASSAAGCAVNDLWDRDIDKQVQRTLNRPLASRALSIKIAIVAALVAISSAVFLAFYLKPLSFWLFLASVPLIILYPLAKRVFPVPQLVMALAWGFGVLVSWSAVSGQLERATWLLWGATVFWALGFDTIYAISDREDDRRIGVNSSAIFFNEYIPIAVGAFFLGTTLLLANLGLMMQLQVGFWVTLFLAALGWTWQCLRLCAPQLPSSAYNQMFSQNVWIGFLLLSGMIVGG
ncbi:4-hydroxybenzoate octaprenyltransferase [Brasilonema sp. UFV-L1]|nr:4-hydroxybenzoate octaprenyltransferase [Brasilonema sp. UFV-L1]